MKTLIFLLTFILCLISSVSAQNCEIFGERVTLGDYFSPTKDKSNIISIAANTKDDCKDIQIFIKSEDEKEFNLSPQEEKHIDGEDFTEGQVDYSIYSYFFRIGEDIVQEGQKFYYIIKQKDTENQKEMFEVYVPLKTKKQQDQIDKILVYGDYDANVQELPESDPNYYGQYTHDYLMNQLEKREFDQMLFLGDLAYDLFSENYLRGEKFFRKASPYYGSIPQINTYGNHESGGAQENYDYKFVDQYFQMPGYQKGMNKDFSFDSTYAQFINFHGKYLWYKEDEKDQKRVTDDLEQQLILAQNRRSERPWIIVFSHYPIYYDDEEGFDANKEFFQPVEDLLNKYKVDMYISAHVHCYQRYHPVINGKIQDWQIPDNAFEETYQNPKSPLYIVDGIAGQAHYTKAEAYENRDILAVQDTAHVGGGRLQIYNATHLNYQHYRFQDEEIIDNFWVVKDDQYENNTTFTIIVIVFVVFAAIVGMGLLFWNHNNNKYNKESVLLLSRQQEQSELQQRYSSIENQ